MPDVRPPVLLETLAAVESERRSQFDRSFTLVDRLLAEMGEDDLAERLYAAIPRECPWEVVADLYGILEWSTGDNGAALRRSTERWLLAGEYLRKVRIALHRECFPFFDRSVMEHVLELVAKRYPLVAARCNELIETRRRTTAPDPESVD